MKRIRNISCTVGDTTRTFQAEYDFSDVAENDLLEHTMRSVQIDWQRQLRGNVELLRAIENGSTVPVRVAAFAPGRRVKDPVVAADKALAKLTPEQIAAIIEKHTQ